MNNATIQEPWDGDSWLIQLEEGKRGRESKREIPESS
jgi:hypothetical protein